MKPGDRVELVGLEARAEMNGWQGVLIRESDKPDRWEVLLDQEKKRRNLKSCNLALLQEAGSENLGECASHETQDQMHDPAPASSTSEKKNAPHVFDERFEAFTSKIAKKTAGAFSGKVATLNAGRPEKDDDRAALDDRLKSLTTRIQAASLSNKDSEVKEDQAASLSNEDSEVKEHQVESVSHKDNGFEGQGVNGGEDLQTWDRLRSAADRVASQSESLLQSESLPSLEALVCIPGSQQQQTSKELAAVDARLQSLEDKVTAQSESLASLLGLEARLHQFDERLAGACEAIVDMDVPGAVEAARFAAAGQAELGDRFQALDEKVSQNIQFVDSVRLQALEEKVSQTIESVDALRKEYSQVLEDELDQRMEAIETRLRESSLEQAAPQRDDSESPALDLRALYVLEESFVERSDAVNARVKLVEDALNEFQSVECDRRLSLLESQVKDAEALSSKQVECDHRLSSLESSLQDAEANRESSILEERLSVLEEYSRSTHTSDDQNANLAVRALESKLSVKIDILQEVLVKSGSLHSSFEAVAHRRLFDAYLASSGWCPSGDFLEIFELDTVLDKLMPYSDMRDMISVRATSLSTGHLKGSLHRLARGKVELLIATAEQDPSILLLQEAILPSWDILLLVEQDAEDGSPSMEKMRGLMSKVAQAQLDKFATCGSAELCIMEAEMRSYVKSGFISQEELLSQTRAAKEKVAAIDRKLRAAVSWATSKDTSKLEQAIRDAKVAGADPKEIDKADEMLQSLLPPGRRSLQTKTLAALLQEAVPEWPSSSVAGALEKLQRISVFTVRDLSEALLDSGDEYLTDRLRDANLKVFKLETLLALKAICRLERL